MNDVLKTGAVSISTASVRYSIDYHNLDMSNLDNIKNQLEEQTKAYKSESYNFSMPSQEIFGEYAGKSLETQAYSLAFADTRYADAYILPVYGIET